MKSNSRNHRTSPARRDRRSKRKKQRTPLRPLRPSCQKQARSKQPAKGRTRAIEIQASFARDWRRAVSLARGRGMRHAEAEDVVQVAFAKACERYVFRRGRLAPLFWKILRRSIGNWWRARKRRPVILPEVPTDLPLDAESEPQADRAKLRAVLAALPAADVRFLMQAAKSKRSQREIAAELGLSCSAFKMRVLRIRRRLRKLLHRQGCSNFAHVEEHGAALLAIAVVRPPVKPGMAQPRPSCKPVTMTGKTL